MDVLVLNKDFESEKPLDSYFTLIWTVRYSEAGDFELFVPVNSDNLKVLNKGNYLYLRDSDRNMIIEDVDNNANYEDGAFFKISGRSLESILTRRIVWDQTTITGSLQEGVLKLLDENLINPADPKRKINNFIFEASTDPRVIALQLDAQYWGEELYEVIVDLCAIHNLGFKVTLTDNNEFKFQLYYGEDRSYNQVKNTHVTFSPKFDNLHNSSYLDSDTQLKTMTLIAGEDQTVELNREGHSEVGLERREIFTDATGVSQDDDGVPFTPEVYKKHLEEKGHETLKDHKTLKVFEGRAETTQTFKLFRDFDLGDLVQMNNEYTNESVTRITEFIFAQDMNGYSVYPTFVVDEEK